MPSIRPRLVEEGKPITVNADQNDFAVENDVTNICASTSSATFRDPMQVDVDQFTSIQHNASTRPSSLSKYLPLSSHRNFKTHRSNAPTTSKQKYKTKLITSFVIGKNSSTDGTSQPQEQDNYEDCHMASDDDDHNDPCVTADLSYQPFKSELYAQYYNWSEDAERMEIEDIVPKAPLIVLDGANVAYAYSQALPVPSTHNVEPNALGIQLAVEYFTQAGCRVQVVVPAYWMRPKRQTTKYSAGMATNKKHMVILNRLQEQNVLCCSPPTDDDDAYCISIARREDLRSRLRRKGRHMDQEYSSLTQNSSLMQHSLQRQSSNETIDLTCMDAAFIISNDLYRDAMMRDATNELKQWLEGGAESDSRYATSNPDPSGSIFKLPQNVDHLPRRISYSFADLGSIDQYGDPILDFVPNPRHALISMIDQESRQKLLQFDNTNHFANT